MKCNSCGAEGEKGWHYCPKCGAHQSKGFFNIGNIFSRMRKEMDEMGKDMDESFEKDMEAFDLSPFFKKMKPHGSGFTIKIVSGTGIEPKIDVKTFGEVDQGKVQKQLEKQLGYKTAVRQKIPAGSVEEHPPKKFPTPKTTEEPAAEVKSLGNKVVVDIDLPGVKKEEDIQVAEMDASVEVKAIAGDKGFFKILTKPEEFSLVAKKFHNGKLHLEFA